MASSAATRPTTREVSSNSTAIKIDQIPKLSELYKAGKYDPLPPEQLPEDWPYTRGDAKLNSKIGIIKGDITKLEVDAIVNAAKSSLTGGGGVDGAIHSAAGPGLERECRTLGGCETGDAKITGAYKLPCKNVIHTVGPIYTGGRSRRKLAKELTGCYGRSLEVLVENNLKTIAFCCISTGIYGYPNEDAAYIALETVRNFLESPEGEKVDLVVFCLFMPVDIRLYQQLVPLFFPPAEEEPATDESAKDEPVQETAEGKNLEGTSEASGEAPDKPAREVTADASEATVEAVQTGVPAGEKKEGCPVEGEPASCKTAESKD